MEKAKLTKEQAEALELAKETWSKDIIVCLHVERNANDWHKCKGLNGMILDTLIRALYIGYEVEQTEQEKIQEIWKEINNGMNDFTTDICKAVFKDTLKALGREDLIPKEEKA
jgi:hypothetical protein